MEKIIDEIKSLKDKGTEPAPIYYSKLFIEIMKFGGLDKEDILRYFRYIPSEINNLIKENETK